MKKIELLPIKDFSVLKVIQIEGHERNWFTGFLPYLRTFDPKNYDSIKGDFLDEKIISTVQETLPKSFMKFSEDILFKGQLDERLRTLEGDSRKSVTIQFFPLIPYNQAAFLVGKEFTAYPIGFDLRLLFNEGSEKKHYILDFFLCRIPHDKIDAVVKAIKPI